MPAEVEDNSKPKLCVFPICGATADWSTGFFGETEYYCNRHKPMIPEGFLKKLRITAATAPAVE